APLLCWWQHPALFMDPDSWGYHRLAVNLLAGHGYSWEGTAPYEANVYRPPGLPLSLSAGYRGPGRSAPHALVLPALVSSLTILLVYGLARSWRGDAGTALAAAGAMAVDPVSIYYANFLLTEVYTALIVVAALFLAVRYLRTGQVRFLGWIA